MLVTHTKLSLLITRATILYMKWTNTGVAPIHTSQSQTDMVKEGYRKNKKAIRMLMVIIVMFFHPVGPFYFDSACTLQW